MRQSDGAKSFAFSLKARRALLGEIIFHKNIILACPIFNFVQIRFLKSIKHCVS